MSGVGGDSEKCLEVLELRSPHPMLLRQAEWFVYSPSTKNKETGVPWGSLVNQASFIEGIQWQALSHYSLCKVEGNRESYPNTTIPLHTGTHICVDTSHVQPFTREHAHHIDTLKQTYM